MTSPKPAPCVSATPAKTVKTPISAMFLTSDSLSGFETVLLRNLWHASLVLALMALGVAILLFLRRIYENHRNAKRKNRRGELERVFWGAMAAAQPLLPSTLPRLNRDDAMLVCDLALDILRPLRGEEANRVIRLLQSWPLRSYARQTLAQGRRGQKIRMLSLLAHFDDGESLHLLQQHISDRDFYVQLAALRSLAGRNAVEAMPAILEELSRAKRQNSAMLADVLGRFGEPALPMLTALAASQAQMEVRLAAITAMTSIGSLDAVPGLVELASDSLPDIRAQAIRALAGFGDIRAEPVVLQALNDSEDYVRTQAAGAAGRLQIYAAAPMLAVLLSDPVWWVRYRSAEALYRMGVIGQALLRAHSTEHDRAGETAAQMLAEKEAA
ncbi:MAG: HEAT repeat domain-containing protein [Alphaproteobacteria bacterium]|nr:HEAT repeat domain-containing protein [Alphaproteobacteria bacterium]